MASVKKVDFKVAEGRSPRKVETSTSQDLLNQGTAQHHVAGQRAVFGETNRSRPLPSLVTEP